MPKLNLPIAAVLPVLALLAVSCGTGDGQPSETGAPSETGGDWPMYGLDHSNSVHNRAEITLSPENVSELSEVWRLDGIGGVTGTPAVVDGVVYFADWLGFVRALRAGDGSVLWEQQVADAPISASVAVADDLVIAGDLAGTLYAVSRATGEMRWSTPLNPLEASLFASPVVIGDSVVIGMTDSELSPDDPEFRASVVALDLEAGSERWRVFTDPDEDDSGMWVVVWSSAAYDADRGLVFVGTGNTNVPAPPGSPPGSPAERSRADLPFTNSLLAIRHNSGEVAWATRIVPDEGRDIDVGASPNLFTIGDRDVVGVGAKSGDYAVLDRDTGEVVWEVHLTAGSDIGGVMATAAVGDGVIYVASNEGGPFGGTIFALDMADGSILWQRRFDPPIIGGSLALANGVLYRGVWDISRSEGSAVAIDASDGTVLWTEPIGAPLGGGFSVSNGTLYVGYGSGFPPDLGSAEGGLIAYGLP